EVGEQTWRTTVEDGEAITARLVAERAGQPRFPGTGRAADQQMLAVADPAAGGEGLEQAAVQTAWGAEVGVLDHRGLTQSRVAEPSAQPLVIARRHLAVDQQTEPVLARQIVGRRLVAHGRWCTWRMEGEMAPTPSRYAMIRWLRTESGRPAASIRFRTATPMAASVCWAAKPRARSRGPISALYRPIVVSTSERWP